MPILDAQTLQTLEFRSMVRTNESEKEKRRILISERMKYIIHKSGSVPLLPLLVLAIAIYDVISLLHNLVECMKATMDHLWNQYKCKCTFS